MKIFLSNPVFIGLKVNFFKTLCYLSKVAVKIDSVSACLKRQKSFLKEIKTAKTVSKLEKQEHEVVFLEHLYKTGNT